MTALFCGSIVLSSHVTCEDIHDASQECVKFHFFPGKSKRGMMLNDSAK